MNILIKKFQELGLEVNLKPEGYYDCEILRANGQMEKPWAQPQKNAINPKWKDNFLNTGTVQSSNGRFLDLLFQSSIGHWMTFGSDAGAINSYDQAASWTHFGDRTVNAVVGATNSYDTIGNSATIDPITGNIVMTARMVYVATSAQTIREVAFGGAQAWAGSSYGTASRLSRAVLASPIVLNQNDTLFMSYTLVIPSLAVTPQAVTLAAQNGMNLSGQLKLVGTVAEIIGGVVSVSGQLSGPTTYTVQSSSSGGMIYPTWPRWGMSTDATFPVFNNAATNLAAVAAANTTSQPAYTSGTYNRNWNGQFSPGARTFRSLSLSQFSGSVGYQLLLDAAQTQAADKTLVVSLNFAI